MATLDEPDIPDECKPLYTLQELLQWNSKNQLLGNVASKTLLPDVRLKCNGSRTLVCHDMKGGYLEDRFCQGVSSAEAYRFFHWPHVDIFVYFSHYFITIPPAGWINSAHNHNVFILGTFITEWEDGKSRCEQLLQSEESYKAAADKMVAIAQHHGFDGWLINVENVIQPEKVSRLRDFVKYLTDAMHKVQSNSIVLWYDSVIQTGELKWQDELNDNNKMFFDVCDGIFLNYTWTEDKLHQSATRAKEYGRPLDVYTGVDVFGRGCLGDGGFKTNMAVEASTKYNLSVALFAQGWVFEKADGNMQSFMENEYKFWKLLRHHLEENSIKRLPFYTSFCQGQGQKYYENGKIISDNAWTNLSLQNIQPGICDTENIEQTHTFSESYQGGGCLSLSGTMKNANDCLSSELFSFDAQLPKKCLFLYTYKSDSDTTVFIDVTLLNRSTNESLRYRLCSDESVIDVVKNVGSNSINTICITPLSCLDEVKNMISVSGNIAEGPNWQTRTYIFEDLEPYLLKKLTVCMMCKSAVTFPQTKQVLLGQIQISEAKDLTPVSITKLEVRSSRISQQDEQSNMVSVSCILQWSCYSKEIGHFNIYYSDVPKMEMRESENFKFLGRCVHSRNERNRFKTCNLMRDLNEVDSILFQVQPVYYNGSSLSLCHCPSVKQELSLN